MNEPPAVSEVEGPALSEVEGRVLASTTSHKREPLLPVLEVFGRLGLFDVDLNLHHLLDGGVQVDAVAAAAATHGLRLRVASGGWCDFFHRAPDVDRTFTSVARQVAIARELGIAQLRLFFGRLAFEDYSPAALATVSENLERLSDAHPAVAFMFENHDGASLHPEVCREILDHAARPNLLLNFDPINFARAGVDPMAALDVLRPVIGHLHLKGLALGEYCEFGEGDVDLSPLLASLLRGGYTRGFSVEYEGRFDGTVRLYRSVTRAREVVARLLG
jgi:sugar phosphate isomerase/epimerase